MLLTSTAGVQPARGALSIPALLLAGSIPALLAYNLPPSSTMLNQCLAVGLWGGVVAALAPAGQALRRAGVLYAALLATLAGALGSALFADLPFPLAASGIALLVAALALAWTGCAAADRPDRSSVFTWFALGLLVAGVLSALVALVQVFASSLTDGNWIAHSGLPGRAVGNLRQPNHLCSLLLWGVIAAVALRELHVLRLGATVALVVLMVFAVELSASRTGALGLGLLALWGVLDRRLAKSTRLLLLATPLIYALSYGAMALYGQWSDQAIGAAARLAGEGSGIESPNSRRRIWANALALIAQQPWLGVGFGEFNLAWSLTPFPGRPTAFFDHTHTLPLQLAVELGLPLAALIMVLMGVALWQGWRRSSAATGDDGSCARAAWMLVLLIGLHSLSEYPLWYAYFLLPAAFAWGYALGAGGPPAPAVSSSTAGRIAGVLLVLGAAFALVDYRRVVEIYAPGEQAGPLAERIAAGQRSPFFGHHADYAAATGSEALPGTALAFRRAPHYLLDTRLMIAWARHLAENGEPDQARALAERLREFRNSASDDFFKPCDEGDRAAFQCQPAQSPHPWREYLGRRPKQRALQP
ncbi:O-antigen ligase C-terminal domain-containing protein [Aquincola sp. S2]|uniref:O-antigen ligase C-terminal domain-containing protein n=1 Tax=Pseudaquabacterium terrae TaxID=2732868 RepID=A0ABX2EKM5_9BURK|nr:O-antigen ligase family protein [Aquabacterium terrae]NRF69199.1 O-antigen ligase C-terminal domain-containing protein [Aquabacterium terrae]